VFSEKKKPAARAENTNEVRQVPWTKWRIVRPEDRGKPKINCKKIQDRYELSHGEKKVKKSLNVGRNETRNPGFDGG